MKSIQDIINHYKKEDKQMTNGAAIGYMISAARSIHLTAQQEEKLEAAMIEAMDFKTEEEAEDMYKSAKEV
jgi:hypothetical protein